MIGGWSGTKTTDLKIRNFGISFVVNGCIDVQGRQLTFFLKVSMKDPVEVFVITILPQAFLRCWSLYLSANMKCSITIFLVTLGKSPV